MVVFGDGDLFAEKLMVNPRHVEVQVIGDGTGAAAMPHSPFRSAARVMEQLASNMLYGAS